MSDFHLTPLTASELKEGQRFVWAGDVRQSLGIEGSTFDASVEDGPEAVLVESPCPAQRKWRLLQSMLRAGGDDNHKGTLDRILRLMEAMDKEQGERKPEA